MPGSSTTARRFLILLGGLAAVAALVLGGTWLYVNVIADDAPPPFSFDDVPGTGDDTWDDELDLNGTWTVAAESEAGYRVDEVLNGLDNTVVGRTRDVTGELEVADNAAVAGEIVVDMTTVTTDSDSRDGQFRGSIMNVEEFPTATFTLTEPVSLDELPGSEAPTSLTARGELTLRDVTRAVEAQLQIRPVDGGVEVVGAVPLTFTNFGIEPPNLAFVRVEQEGFVEFWLHFVRQ